MSGRTDRLEATLWRGLRADLADSLVITVPLTMSSEPETERRAQSIRRARSEPGIRHYTMRGASGDERGRARTANRDGHRICGAEEARVGECVLARPSRSSWLLIKRNRA